MSALVDEIIFIKINDSLMRLESAKFCQNFVQRTKISAVVVNEIVFEANGLTLDY